MDATTNHHVARRSAMRTRRRRHLLAAAALVVAGLSGALAVDVGAQSEPETPALEASGVAPESASLDESASLGEDDGASGNAAGGGDGELAAAAAPTVSAVSPPAGPLTGGTVIQITGTGFATATSLSLVPTGGTPVAVSAFAVVSDTRIVARVPAHTAGGSHNVQITNADGTNSTGGAFTYRVPTVTSLTPSWAAPATAKTVTIAGSGFEGTVAANVTFNGVAASAIYVVSDTMIVAQTPTSGVTAGGGRVVVTRNGVASDDVAADDWLFAGAPPAISGLSANSTAASGGVAVGGTLTITGTNLIGVTSVFFGSTEVKNTAAITDNVIVDSATTVRVKVPSRVTGPVEVSAQSAAGRSTPNLATNFDYLPATVPTISNVQPAVFAAGSAQNGGGGGVALITGTNFTGVTASGVLAVCASNLAATSVVVLSNSSLIATFPGNAGTAASCGLRVVNAAGGSVTKADAITYV